MSKVITFSRTFPAYHSKAGQPTFFVEKFWKSLNMPINTDLGIEGLKFENSHLYGKHHTIRAGNRFKAGEYFSPRVWGNDVNPKSGRKGAYHSKQITLCKDVEIKKVWDFEIKEDDADEPSIYLDGKHFAQIGASDSILLAANDGLSLEDMKAWFKYPKPFKGQIICWNESINY